MVSPSEEVKVMARQQKSPSSWSSGPGNYRSVMRP